jgi:hypothetical protein
MDGGAQPLATITTSHPDGMVLMPWGELFVADLSDNSIERFLVDGQGNATPNGHITGNGLSSPLGIVLAPWGEIFVGNEGTGTLSRFTFDSSHTAVSNGTFQTKCGAAPGGTPQDGSRMDWIALVASASTGSEIADASSE